MNVDAHPHLASLLIDGAAPPELDLADQAHDIIVKYLGRRAVKAFRQQCRERDPYLQKFYAAGYRDGLAAGREKGYARAVKENAKRPKSRIFRCAGNCGTVVRSSSFPNGWTETGMPPSGIGLLPWCSKCSVASRTERT